MVTIKNRPILTVKASYKYIWDSHKAERNSSKKFDEGNHWSLHPELVRFKKRKDYQKHKDGYIKRAKDYYRKNIDARREYGRSHYRKNPEKYASRARARRQMIHHQDSGGTDIFYKFRDLLNSLHGKVIYHVDHILPLSVGGSHSRSNLAIATANYNQWKRAKIITDPSIYFGSSQVK